MGKTISDWLIVAEQEQIDIDGFHTVKLEDYQRLKNSGLPVFNDFQLPYSQFNRNNVELTNFLSIYKGFVIRLLPNTKKIPRKYKIGVKSFEECKNFLEKSAEGEDKWIYIVLLTEYELSKGSGIIISNPREVRVEIGDFGIDELSHGKDPLISCLIDLTGIGHITDKMQWGKNKWTLENEREVLRSLRHIELTRDIFNPLYMRGYFEFVISEDKRIRFLDYKTNENYLR